MGTQNTIDTIVRKLPLPYGNRILSSEWSYRVLGFSSFLRHNLLSLIRILVACILAMCAQDFSISLPLSTCPDRTLAVPLDGMCAYYLAT